MAKPKTSKSLRLVWGRPMCWQSKSGLACWLPKYQAN